MSKRYSSIGSELIIHSSNFQNGLERIKRMDLSFHPGGREEIQNVSSLGQALYRLGWSASYSQSGSIKSLTFRDSDEYNRDSRYVLYVIARVVESGGYIKFIDRKNNIAKIYRFRKNNLFQSHLTVKYIDHKSENDLSNLIEFSLDHLFKLNKVPQNIISIINKRYVKHVMES